MYTLETMDAGEAWKELVGLVMEKGEQVEDEEGNLVQELLNVIVQVENPVLTTLPLELSWGRDKLNQYQEQFLNPKTSGEIYTHGNRLREHFGFKIGKDMFRIKTDQLDSVIQRLQNNSYTRRAIMTAFDPAIDHYQNELPSLILVDFKLRHNKLNTTALWRGQEVFHHWLSDWLGIRGLAEYVSRNLKISIGPIIVHSVSAYILGSDYDKAVKYIRRTKKLRES